MRIVILTSEHPPVANLAIQTLLNHRGLKRHNIKVAGIVMADTVSRDEKGINRLWKLWQKFGSSFFLRFVGMIVIQLAMLRLGRWLSRLNSRRYRDLDELAQSVNARYHETKDINSPKTLEKIRQWQPDLVVSCLLLQKVAAELLSLPKHGAINFHPALTSEHRGTFASFWTLFHNFKSGGATVHRMTPDFDAGEVLMRRRFFVHSADSVHCLNLRAAKLGGKLLAKAIVKIARGEKHKVPLRQKLGRFLSLPTESQTLEFFAHGKRLIKWENLFDY